MSDNKSSNPSNAIPSCRRAAHADARARNGRDRQGRKARQEKGKEHEEFAKTFLTEGVTEAERDKIQRLVRTAVELGKTEALVYSFSSDLCSDGGRAINNAAPDWPDTLQGKARKLYDRYQQAIKQRGYKRHQLSGRSSGGYGLLSILGIAPHGWQPARACLGCWRLGAAQQYHAQIELDACRWEVSGSWTGRALHDLEQPGLNEAADAAFGGSVCG